jgi:hypothetical protein
MNINDWIETADNGTSGDMVGNILNDWQIRENKLNSLLIACKYATQWYSDNISIMPVAFQTVVNELESAISECEY